MEFHYTVYTYGVCDKTSISSCNRLGLYACDCCLNSALGGARAIARVDGMVTVTMTTTKRRTRSRLTGVGAHALNEH